MENNEYNILSPKGAVLHKGVLNTDCTRKFSLMSEDSVTVKFSLNNAVEFPVGSKISIRDFVITSEQTGVWNKNTGVWDYQLKFDAYYYEWANKILRYVIPGADSAKETSFSLTATIEVHLQVILNCLNLLGYKFDNSPFRAEVNKDDIRADAKLVTYNNLSILGGIQAIAEAFECEWWVIDNAIWLGKLEKKDADFTFEAGVNVSSISFSSSKTNAPNRIYVFGSDRNLPTNYRPINGDDTIGGVVNKRLMLPEGVPYLQTDRNLDEAEIVESVVTIDDVYPRTQLTISEEPEVYTSEAEQEDGTIKTQNFYRIRYGNDFPFLSSYILPGEELHVIFGNGEPGGGLLNGMDFAVKFNPKGLNEKDTDGNINPEAQMFEIVVNEDYGRELPDSVLLPKKGDTFVLYGWDSTKLSELGLIASAEDELLEEGKKALEEYAKDLSTCTCPMAWDYMRPLITAKKEPQPGDVVTIVDSAHFGKGGRKSRVIGYEYNLESNYSSYVYTCGENVSVARLQAIEQKLEGLAKTGDKVQLQNSLDFLSKRYSDSTPYHLSMRVGAHFGNYIQGLAGAAIDRIGNAEFESITSRSFLKVFELIYNRINAVEGEVDFSDSATVDAISDNADGSRTLHLRKRWEGDFNAFQPGDIVYGYVNNLQASGVYGKAWGVVTSTDKGDNNSITVNPYPGYDCPSGVNIPFAASMVIAKHGNAIEPNADNARLYPEFIVPSASDTSKYINKRRSSFVISAPDGNIRYLHGINSPKANLSHVGMVLGRIPEGLFPQTSAIGQIAADGMPRIYAKGIIAQEILRTDYRGLTIRTQNYRGEWNSLTAKSAEAYYASNDELFDVVTHNGRLWQCYVSGTKDEPCDDASCGWLPMSEAGFNVWSIGSSYDTITKSNDGEYTPARLDVWAILQNGNQCRQIESEDELFGDYGLAIVVDGYEEEATYLDIFTPEDDEGDYFESESDSYDYIRAESVPAVKNGFIDTKYIPDSGITIRLVSTADGTEYARKHISVVSDGADGLNGAQGPMAYPAGAYDADAVYDASKGVSPIVLYSGQYFILKAGQKWEGESVEGGNPAVNSTSDNPKWELVDKFNTIFADIVMANFAKLSHAVFYDRYMFSGFGKSYNGNNNNFDYAHIDEYLNGDEKYSFKPNLLINLQTGEIFADSLTAGNTEFSGKELTSEEVVFPGNAIPVTDASSIPYSEKYTFDKNDGEKTVSGTVEICTFSGLMYKKLRIRANSCSIYCQGFKSSVGQPKCTISAKLELQLYRQGASTPSNTLTSQISTYGYKTLVPKDTWDTDGLFFSDTNRYTLKLHYEISAAFPDPVAGEDVIGSASVNFPGITVEVYDDEKEEYKSIYYKNGFAVGQSSKDYIMAYNDPNNQGMAFIMQNKGGAGISCDSRGLLVKDENTGGNWTSLADYIKQITNSQ